MYTFFEVNGRLDFPLTKFCKKFTEISLIGGKKCYHKATFNFVTFVGWVNDEDITYNVHNKIEYCKKIFVIKQIGRLCKDLWKSFKEIYYKDFYRRNQSDTNHSTLGWVV